MNSIAKLMFRMYILPVLGFFFTGSQTFTTDLATVKTAIDNGDADATAQQGRAVNATGPMMDLDGMILTLQQKANEMAQIINYIIYGKIGGTGTSGILRSGDGNAANTYTKLGNILTSLTS